ncbi:aldo/keto reductase [Desulfopila sp. IMCC35006]|uniref:aldo/keto reductase n=1 Tax=Desulfopila sp. IMCC35006 TaxID=2569542 RepID=UPI0010ABA746|nr:aldo/keto reductase [Desulfopila sp. IMCC35006]TKB24306.1 aldo/keto reductase [Desulfopila sp. IMCC35006]
MKYLPVNNTDTIPALGLGTWKSDTGEVARAVSTALDIGYRHIDCASIYQNQKEIGTALGEAITAKRVKREELWITSKLWNNAHARKHVQPALERTLLDLQLDYLDLFLIHWPINFQPNIVFPKRPEEFLPPEAIPIIETWQAMEKMVKKGLCRFIGVCNFNLPRLIELKRQAAIQPVMNQIELHPYLQQRKMVEYCKNNGLLLTAYSPLGSGDRPAALKKDNEPSLLTQPIIVDIAERNNMTPGQVLLVWGLSRGTVVIPKSTHPERLQENFLAADLELGATDLLAIDGLEQGYRFVDGSFFQSPGSPYTVTGLWKEE